MKKIGFIVLFVGCAVVSLLSCTGNTTQPNAQGQQDTAAVTHQAAPAVTPQDLPEAITAFVKEHFQDATIARVELDNERGGKEFDVYLNDGTEIEFDANNQWDNVDCRTKAVPAALVPEAIANYVKTNYATLPIVKIDKDARGFDIELSNGLDLEFDTAGKFVKIDD